MTEEQKGKIRKVICDLYVELGRLKQILKTKGFNYEYPHSVFLKDDEKIDPRTSLIYEVDGLNQLWNGTDKFRDVTEELLDFQNIDFDEAMKVTVQGSNSIYEGTIQIERSLNAKHI